MAKEDTIRKFVEQYGEQYDATAKDFEIPKVKQTDRIEAQTIWTALMTDTLLPEETEEEQNV